MNSQVLIDRKLAESAEKCQACGTVTLGDDVKLCCFCGYRLTGSYVCVFATPAPIPDAAEGVDADEQRHEAIMAIHRVLEAVPSASLYSFGEALVDAGYVIALRDGGGVPEGWQARFVESGDRWDAWQTCSKEHHDLVKRCPNEWPGYEVREIYTVPLPKLGTTTSQAGVWE